MRLSVLISLYRGDHPDYFNLAMVSIWDGQYMKPDEIVLVKDGPLSFQLNEVVRYWAAKLGNRIKVIELPENLGLGAALNEGLKYCQGELVARMDADDISLPDRFEKQVAFMHQHSEIDVSSAWLQECSEDLNHIQAVRFLPSDHEKLLKFSKRRNPISHPAAIFRRSSVLAVGGYPPFKKSQDYALWSLMLVRGYRLANVQEVLVKMRLGEGLAKRRGVSYFARELEILRYQRKIGFLSLQDFWINVMGRVAVRLAPNAIKRMLYKFAR